MTADGITMICFAVVGLLLVVRRLLVVLAQFNEQQQPPPAPRQKPHPDFPRVLDL